MPSNRSVEIRNLSFRHESAGSRLFESLSVAFPRGWTGIVGPNGAGKTTLLELATGVLQPDAGTVVGPTHVATCDQRTDRPPAGLPALLAAHGGAAGRLRALLGVADDFEKRWGNLSHGERKRAQLAVALGAEPDLLAVDEPTNHVDAATRHWLLQALRTFRGVGLIVSHDRELLDTLCRQCLFLDERGAVLRPGGYSAGAERALADAAKLRQDRRNAAQEVSRLATEAQARRREVDRSKKLTSKRGLAIKDHDARARRNLARVTGRDGQAGQRLRQVSQRVERARERVASIHAPKERAVRVDVQAARSARDFLLRVPAGTIELGGGRRLAHPALTLRPGDRVGVTGRNGAGKSTLVRALLQDLAIDAEHVTVLTQEIDADDAARIVDEVRALPRDRLGSLMTVLGCLGSRPDRVLETARVSPGELRKLLLARGLGCGSHLIVADEPTNHLDLPSIAALEDALAASDVSLLLVSHDLRFLERLTDSCWHVEVEETGSELGDSRVRDQPP